MAVREPIKWDEANFKWNEGSTFPNQSSTPFTWDDVALIQQLVEVIGLDGDPDVHDIDDTLDSFLSDKPDKKKKLIKLICKVQGKTYKETKEIDKVKINIKDVKLLIKEVLGINVTIL
tara:strand:+ start:114 stop:467 length:354 start_codon:yes stop_codon:yes gene_type:complete